MARRPRPKKSAAGRILLPRGLTLLYEDADLLVVDKPAGLLTVGTERDKTHTAYYVLTDYVRQGAARSRSRVFIVHRLDRDTSGLLVFAKTESAKLRLQTAWPETDKRYLAVVHGRCAQAAGTVRGYLAENQAQVVYTTQDASRGKWAETAWQVLRQSAHCALLEVHLLTGRKNQIRVHLADLGHPILGDRKYGHARDPHPRLALHAARLSFVHPRTGQRLEFHSPQPRYFRELLAEGEPGTPRTQERSGEGVRGKPRAARKPGPKPRRRNAADR